MTPAAQAAAELMGEAARLVEAPDEGEQAAPEDETPDLSILEADTTGIEDLLEAPAEEEEDEEEPVAPDPEDEYQYEDPEKLQAKLRKLEKKLTWSEEQRVKQGVKNWRQEATRRFPLADVEEINATSRRAFLREAEAQHQRYAKKLKPLLGQLKQTETQEQAASLAQERAQEENDWGLPASGPPQPMVEQAEGVTQSQQALDRRRHGSVKDMVKARFQFDERFNKGI
jgi:hypothetical protein